MSQILVPSREPILQRIAESLAATPEGGDGTDLVERYFRHVATEELADRPVEILAGAVRTHVELARHRMPGTANVAVTNPTTEHEVWANPRTMVQIVTDDMPFLVDSVTGELVAQGFDVHLVVHPQFVVSRDVLGNLEAVLEVDPPATTGPVGSVGRIRESWMMLTVDREGDEERRELIASRIAEVLSDVREAVEDWAKMRSRCLVIAAEIEGAPPKGVSPAEVARSVAFLRWMSENHFTFLGYREYALTETEGGEAIVPVTASGLGLLRSDPSLGDSPIPLSEDNRRHAHEPTLLIVTKANSRSTVHRRAYLDYVGIKQYDENGRVLGERRFLGLYASTAYTDSITRLPFVAQKIADIIRRSGVAPGSHTAKDLLGVLESYPRDELFQASAEQLYDVAIAVTRLQERRRTRLFIREDDYGRYVSAIVYIPRDRYNTVVRLRMADILKEAFAGDSIEFSARVSESALSRIQYVIRMPKGVRVRTLSADERDALEQRLVEATRTWSDRLGEALYDKLGEAESDRLMARFGRGFGTAYEETFTTSQGVADLHHLDRIGDERRTSVTLYRPTDAPATVRRFKLFRIDPLSLSDILPIFSHMGVEVIDEQPYEVRRSDGVVLNVYDFGLRVTDAAVWEAVTHEQLRDLFESAVAAVWDGVAESDGFNRLVLGARLTWRQVVVLRTVARYLRQTRSTFSQQYLEDALVSNPAIAADLVALFETRFDPDRYAGAADGERTSAAEAVAARVVAALDDVSSLDHDRIIRAFLGVVQAGLRTNYYQAGPTSSGGEPSVKAYVSIKLDPALVPDLPAPRPAFEIWVYSPRVEGIHLRFGPVARGGLRWSDRREDFRTEILGLVKAQMVKNAVIVPTGSKGGFFPKALPDPTVDRDAWLEEGKAAYRMFVSGLLDLTDNRVRGSVVPPERTVRHDGDDPYLVVAADKGTATFSDIANGVAQSYGFWLDDAFASGGSAGYDHKTMGITARGAWESVKRHFREMGRDTQSEDFTVVGVGDMSGDVFGNGMLLSEHIRLVAAFDHRHLFLDPNPDPARSFEERRRLFALPRSSWDDYDKSLISEGGGVFRRSLKSVKITPQMVEALGLPDGTTAMTPAELMHAILLAPVDLLWNGGIGTYVKASTEEHLDVGDRANDAIRVDGVQLRVQVVGEGGNLGLSQLGRIEAARNGVRLNTDAIDNSAGVDTSDHEVNIKILLGDVVRRGEMKTKERNKLLASMTDEIADQVLRDNYEQNVLLGNARAQRTAMAPVHIRIMRWLEERGELDRAIEFLPSDAELEVRHHEGRGLTSPELCVLIAYAKLALKKDLLASDLPDDPFFAETLAAYFPAAIRQKYVGELHEHPLRREIISNAVANSMINRGGATFAFRAIEETGATPDQVARAFVICREVFGLADFVARVEVLDNVIGTESQTMLYFELRRLLDRSVRWFLASRAMTVDIRAEIDRFAEVVAGLGPQMAELLRGAERERLDIRAAEFEARSVPPDLAMRAAGLLDWYSLLDIVDIAADTKNEPTSVAPLYYFVSESFGIDTMLTKVTRLPREDRWDALARGALRDDLYAVLESMTRAVLDANGGSAEVEPAEAFEVWAQANTDVIQRSRTSLAGIQRLENPNIAALSVALRTLRSVVRAGSSSA